MASAVYVEKGIEYARHDGVALLGDLYAPAAPGTYPALALVHGGAWQRGSRDFYRYWGPYLAEHGYVALAIDYRLATPEQPTYPQNVYDVKAAIQFLRGRGAALKVDPSRIGLMGDSAGGHLAALCALSGDSPKYTALYRDDPYYDVSRHASLAVTVYAVLDLLQQWEHDQPTRGSSSITERYLGGPPMTIRDTYYEASPINWATVHHNQPAFLVVWGTEDDIVDPATQSVAFVTALKRADFYVRTVPVLGAPHFWIGDPFDDPMSYPAFLAPRLLRFLAERL